MWPEAPESTDGHHPEVVELHLFVPAADGTTRSVLREDDGLTFAAADGAHRRTTLVVERRGETVTLRGDVDGDGYPEFRRQSFRLVLHGATVEHVEHGGEVVEATDGAFVLPNSGQAFDVRLRVG